MFDQRERPSTPMTLFSEPTSRPVGRPGGSDTDLRSALDAFLPHRARLEAIACRILGDACAAEDVVQDAWLRWQRADRDRIRNPAAFLTTTVRNLAINVLQSASRRHESATVSSWEAIAGGDDPAEGLECAVEVEHVLTILMTHVTSTELAAYLLRKGLDYPYRDVARLLCTSDASARQLVRRAQVHLAGDPVRAIDEEARQRLVEAFVLLVRTGDRTRLETLLVEGARTSRRPRRPDRKRRPAGRVGTRAA